MGKLDVRQVQTNPVATQIVSEYRPDGFIADRVLTTERVAQEKFQYYTYGRNENLRTDVDYKKADGSRAKEADLTFTTATGTCEEYAVAVEITDRERSNADSQLRLEQSKLNLAADQLLLAREVRVATLLTNAGGGITTATPSNNWNVDAATIEADIKTAKLSIWQNTGKMADTIVIPFQVAVEVAVQSDIREIIKYTVDGRKVLELGDRILPASLWGLEVIVPLALKVTAHEGQADTTGSDVWGDDVRVLYTGRGSNVWGDPVVARRFEARAYEVRQWREEPERKDVYEVSEVCAEIVTAATSGYEMLNVLS